MLASPNHPILRGLVFSEAIKNQDYEAIGAVLLTASDRLREASILRNENIVVSMLAASGGKSCGFLIPEWRDGEETRLNMLCLVRANGDEAFPSVLFDVIKTLDVEVSLKEPKRNDEMVVQDIKAWDNRSGRIEGADATSIGQAIHPLLELILSKRGPFNAFSTGVSVVDLMLRMRGNQKLTMKYADARDSNATYGEGVFEVHMIPSQYLK